MRDAGEEEAQSRPLVPRPLGPRRLGAALVQKPFAQADIKKQMEVLNAGFPEPLETSENAKRSVPDSARTP